MASTIKIKHTDTSAVDGILYANNPGSSYLEYAKVLTELEDGELAYNAENNGLYIVPGSSETTKAAAWAIWFPFPITKVSKVYLLFNSLDLNKVGVLEVSIISASCCSCCSSSSFVKKRGVISCPTYS